MSTSTPQENNDEKQLPAPATPLELVQGEEPEEITGPLQNLENAKTIPEAREIMEALVKEGILTKVKEEKRELYNPTANNEERGNAMISAFRQVISQIRKTEKTHRKSENPATPEGNVQGTRARAKKVVNARKPEAARARPENVRSEKAPELILIDPKDYHKLDLLKEENRPLPQSRLIEATKSILLPFDQNAALAALEALVITQSEALAKQINRHVDHIKAVNTYTRLNEVTDNLVKQGLLIRRGRDLVANPNFGSTIGLENAIRSKEKEIEAFMKEYNEIANDPAGLEITMEKSRRVGKETKTFSDRYAARFVLGGKTIRLVKVMKRHPNSENLNLDTNKFYTQYDMPIWLRSYVEIKNGQISLKKEAPKAQKPEEPKVEKQAEKPQAKQPTEKANDQGAKSPATRELDPMQKDEQALSKMIKANPELKIITRMLHAFSIDRPTSIHPSMDLQHLSNILKESFDWNESSPAAPRSLLDLAKNKIEPDLETFKKIAAFMESVIKKLSTAETSVAPSSANEVTETAQEKAA